MDRDVRYSESWEKDVLTGRQHEEINRYSLPAEELARTSLSGHERNKLFLSQDARAFHDVSGVSGLDSIKDSRAFAVWDFDRDGWQDIALTNINAPVLALYRNNLSSLNQGRDAGMLAVRCVGGNRSATADTEFSPRDGYGAKIYVKLADKTLYRELHCGEGLAAQNSKVLMFGLGPATAAESILIRWPSGKEQVLNNVAENSLVTAYENPADGGEDGFAVEPYRQQVDMRALTKNESPAKQFELRDDASQSAEFVMYTSMATWCSSCREHVPELARLRKYFDPDQLAMYGVPVDLEESAEKLKRFEADENLPYDLLTDLANPQRQQYKDLVMSMIHSEALPTTVITSGQGKVQLVITGIPSVSQIRGMIKQRSP